MKSFEEHLAREQYNSDSRDRAAIKRRTDRSLTRNERERDKVQLRWTMGVIVWAVIVAIVAFHGIADGWAMGKHTAPAESPAETTTEAFVEVQKEAQEKMLEENAEISRQFYEKFKSTYVTEDAITMLAKLIYGEARGCSTTEQAAVVWNVLNRVDSPEFPDYIEDAILQENAYDGYSPNHPVVDEFMRLAEDVIDRWTWEKWDGGDYGRVLPKEYLYFHGDGKVNWFRIEYQHTGEYWDWSLPSPYEEG